MRRMLILLKNTCKSNKECPIFLTISTLNLTLADLTNISSLKSQKSNKFRAKMSCKYPMTILVEKA